MNTIELSDAISRINFLKYLSKRIKEVDDISVVSRDINNFQIIFDNDDNASITPSYGEFHWLDNISGNEFIISYSEEGEPVTHPGELTGVAYFKRFKVSHQNLIFLKEFVIQAITDKDIIEEKKIKVYKSTCGGYFEHCGKVYAQDIDKNIYIPDIIKDNIVSQIDNFLSQKTRDRYLKYGRLYKTSFLLTGVPGSGKTSIIKAIACKYNKPIYIFNFSKKLDDEILIGLMRSIKNDSIILFEDLDAFFIDRQPQGINISFSALLNILDGVYGTTTGCITFITANNSDRLDPALIRPGRVDKIIKFDYPRKKEIKKAFYDMIDTDPPPNNFEEFYNHIKDIKISMAGIIDHLFKYHLDNLYITKIDELIDQTKLYQEIINDKTDKLYS